jgi:quercetin dioxygenase-like cupin family protein
MVTTAAALISVAVLKVGDVLIVPPGVIRGWADIPDHVDYLSFRPSHGVMKNGWVNPTIVSK